MGVLSKIWRKKSKKPPQDFVIGRVSKDQSHIDHSIFWQEAVKDYRQCYYLKSIENVLKYLQTFSSSTINYEQTKGQINFTIHQGSKIINGRANHMIFEAVAYIVKIESFEEDMLRQLLEHNFELKFSRFALDDYNNIILKFDSLVEDASPIRLVDGLKELALVADKKDDELIGAFFGVKHIETDHIIDMSRHEKEIKYRFFKSKIKKILDSRANPELDWMLYPGACSYLILSSIYVIDYLVAPEGLLREKIKEMHNLFFDNNLKTVFEKNALLLDLVNDLYQIPYQKFAEDLYLTKTTFADNNEDAQDWLQHLAADHLPDAIWYKDNSFLDYAQAICDYLLSFTIFTYNIKEIYHDLIKLYFSIVENPYFNELGLNKFYIDDSKQINKNLIQKSINLILSKYNLPKKYAKDLDYSSLFCFSYSFIKLISNIAKNDLDENRQ